MSEKKVKKTFLTYQKDKPLVELKATGQIFPIILQNSREVLIHLERPKDNVPIKNLYEEGGIKMKSIGANKVEIKAEDLSYCVPYFKRFFSKMTQKDGSDFKKPSGKAAQLAWIGNHRGLRIEEEVVKAGLLAVSISSVDGASDINTDELEDEIGGTVHTFVRIYDPEQSKMIRVRIEHHHREITEPDNVKWRKATGKSEMDTEEGDLRRRENYNIIQDLYLAIIEDLEGVLINGKVCNSENRDDWASAIPFNWMYMVVGQAFRGTQLKN